jgi:hypothetical protein
MSPLLVIDLTINLPRGFVDDPILARPRRPAPVPEFAPGAALSLFYGFDTGSGKLKLGYLF